MKKTLKIFLILFVTIVLIALMNNYYIANSTKKLIFDDINQIEFAEYALLLGTTKYLPDGTVNSYYKNRIEASVFLYNNNKCKKIIISADTLNKYQENETELMKQDLILNGVNETDLILDKNAKRTWSSIINFKSETNSSNVIIISQKFHLERAIFLAKKNNIHAIGYTAKGGTTKRLRIREIASRMILWWDLFIN